MPDDGGVLGNLPRSRPGQRSAKRAGPEAADADTGRAGASRSGAAEAAERPAKASAKAASRAERSGSKAAADALQSRPRSTARPKAAAGPRRAAGAAAGEEQRAPGEEQRARDRGGDPVTGAIRGAAGLAAAGAKVAGGVARELLRRMPRP